MSSDDSMDDFIVASDSGSDFDAAPPPKKAKKSPAAKAPAKPKATSSKAAASKKSTSTSTGTTAASKAKASSSKAAAPPKKRKAVTSDGSDNDDDDDDDDREVNGSSSTLENHNVVQLDSEADSDGATAKKKAPAKKAAATNKSASDTYQKLTQVEHVLKRPDTYIGSIEAQTQPMWVYDSATSGIAYRNITFVPGLYKIFDEIIVNAADNKRNDASMDTMKIEIQRESGTISCWNNGRGIPVEIHAKEKIWIPELIFGHLLSSSNYDDDQKKVTGGRNGYGAKLANIYSHEFIVETADAKNGKKYKQVWKNNMSNAGKPKITDNAKGDEWTKITFKPDFARFGMPDGIDDDTEALLTKRVYDMAGTLAGVKVYLNGKKLAITNFRKYVEMYTNAVNEIAGKKAKGKKPEKKDDDFPAASQATSREGSVPPLVGANADGSLPAAAASEKVPIVYEKISDRWEVAFAPSDGQFSQVSFVNSIATTKGGTHIEYISKQIVDGIIESISKKNKKHMSTIKAFAVKNQLWVFVNCLIENPSFDSQTKENMTLPSKKYGSKCNISDSFMKKVLSSGVVDSILHWAQFKQDQLMKKTDGTKRARMLGIAKLDDANKAGTKDAKNCTLILTEGDSAKTFAISGLSVVGRDTYGVFPLRGKLLNVRDAAGKQLTENQEIGYLKKILGLQNGKAYTSVESLRYGKLMVMTDQDHDGSHIKGLIINFLDHFFPGLLQIPGFLVEFITPIVKASKGKKYHSFFTIPEYETWKSENDDGRGWHIKYYKGLGTSTAKDAKEYFSDLRRHMIKFAASTAEDRALVDMAFNKKKADDRKEWLRGFVPGTFLDHNTREIPIREFINKELVLFSMADNIRSIPSVIDGFKPGQRKVLFGCFKRNLKSEAKVAQLVGYISEATAYHHGEQSLAGTIVGMAQHFVGNNNINQLMPNGQFGTRLQGGKDHASPRYIFTSLAPITRKVFRKEDDEVLNYLNDDGQSIEPTWYIPILPMVLVNGSDGIGTGWSSAIPNYNPAEIVANLRRKMAGEPMEPMHPWFRGFKGPIEDLGAGRYNTSGIACMTSDDTIEIFELPIRVWTNSYVEQLLAWSQTTEKQPAIVKEFTSQSTETSVHLIVVLTAEGKAQVKREGLDKVFRLTASVSTTNMVAFDANGKIKKYNSPEEIISDFYDIRLTYYMKRKDHLVNMLTLAYERFANQARFIQMFMKGEIKISNRDLGEIVRDLRRLKFRPFPKVQKAHVAADPDASMVISPEEDLEEIDDESAAGDIHDYDYLLEMPIYSLTAARAKKLMGQRDEKEHELKVLLGQTPKSMWVRDLDEFMTQWEALLVEDEASLTLSSGQGGVKGKGKGKIGQMKGNTLESAFAKAAALKAATQASASPEAKPTKAKTTKSLLGGAASSSKPKASTAKLSPKAKASASAVPAKKKKKLAYDSDFDDESDEDDKLEITLYDDSDEEESAGEGSDVDNDSDDQYGARAPARAPAPAPARAPAARARKIIDIDDSASDGGMSVDEDDDDSFVVPPPKKR